MWNTLVLYNLHELVAHEHKLSTLNRIKKDKYKSQENFVEKYNCFDID